MTEEDYTIVVGLEIHVQLQTESKLFCACSTQFGSPPNTQTCPVCTGMPGSLPVLNGRALRMAIKAGLALNCDIERRTKWDRKHYFYPDLPKGYQISQFDRPICSGGWLDVVDSQGRLTGDHVRFERAHLEEDAGKSLHDETGAGGDSRIDLNRAGTPLLEIVTKPDLRGAQQARDFLTELKLILIWIGVSDGNMQQGNLRVDANVNILIGGDPSVATPIVEVKNLNSFRAVERSIQYEAERQWASFQQTGQTRGEAPKQTRGWNDQQQQTVPQREKEESADYRYFPDPDLIAIHTSAETINSIRSEFGHLPAQVRASLTGHHGLTEYDADVLVKQGQSVVSWFDRCVAATGNARLVSNWIQQEVLRSLNDRNETIEDYPVSPASFSALLKDVETGRLNQSRAKEVLAAMVDGGLDVAAARQKLGIVDVDDEEIVALCRRLIDENPKVAAEIRAGNAKAIGPLIGAARKTNPNATPGLVQKTLLELLSRGP